MPKVAITEQYLEDIADAIREKTGLSNTYYPSEMAPAILTISGGGGITPTGTININTNGTHNVTTYASANVQVPNSYTSSDEGKVVSSGALVAQTSATYTTNNTYDTTLINSVTVNVSGGGSNLQAKTNINPTTSSQTITPDTGYDGLSSVQINAMPSGSVTAGNLTQTNINPHISVNSQTGEITASVNRTGAFTAFSATSGYINSSSLSSLGTYTLTGSATQSLTVQGATTYTPTTSNQTIASGTYLTGTQTISGDENLVAGNIKKNVSIFGVTGSFEGGGGTPTITSLSVTPSESEQTFNSSSVDGYKPVTVEAISSTYVGSGITRRDSTDLTASGATVSVPAGYYEEAGSKSVSSGSATGPSSLSGSSATISTGTNTITLTKTGITTTPTVSAGYVSSATSSTATVALTASVTVNPTPTASGKTVTIPAGYYSAQTTKDVDTMTLPTSASASATSGYTSKATISRSTSDQYINIPTGYNTAGAYYKINAVANGSATGPSSLSGTSAAVSTGTNTITLTKTGVTTTPTVSAGYVSSATASTATVTLTASVTTKAAATYHPSTTAQSIASGTYLTGAQTIAAVTTTNLSASNIVSGVTIKVGDSSDDDCVASVTGNVSFATYYTGSTVPSSSLGQNGDIYLQS